MNQGAYMESPLSNRGRKRKHAPSSAGFRRPSISQGHSYGHGYPPQHPGDPHRPYPPPPQGMMPGHGQGPLGLNLPPTIQDELPDSVLDDLDRLTPRDLAVARYAKNHELLSMIFDARRIDTMQPAPSPYSSMSESDLKAKVESLNKELTDLSESHVNKMRRLKQVLSGKVAVDSPIWDEAGDGTVEDTSATPEEWAKNPSRGRIVGLGFVRADTPPELKQPPPPQPKEEVNPQAGEEEKKAIEALNQSHGVVQPAVEPTPPPPAPVVEPPAQTADVTMSEAANTEQTTPAQPAEASNAAEQAPPAPSESQTQPAQAETAPSAPAAEASETTA